MFNLALRKLVLINAGTVSAAIVLLLFTAFFLIRSNLEHRAYGALEDYARTIAASDLDHLFEDDEEEEDEYVNLLRIDAATFWVVSANGTVLLSSGNFSDSSVASLDDAVAAISGDIQKSIVTGDSGKLRVVSVATESLPSEYIVQVAESDTVGPELNSIIWSLVVAGAVGLALAVVAGYVVAARTLRPIQKAFDLQRDFVSGASHELQTPITVVQANADAVQRLVDNLGDEDTRLLEDIQLESEFLGQLVRRLAELARLQDDFNIPIEPVDVSVLCSDLARSMDLLAQKANVSVSARVTGETVVARADRVMLRQVLQSLIENALKYAGNGSAVELIATANGTECELLIRDNGVGIPVEHLAHVTERFYRVDKARSRSSGSSGLGLAMAQEAISTMGGTLTVESTDGSGTTVRIRLPAG